MDWNCPNHLAGLLAELAELVSLHYTQTWDDKLRYWKTAIALRRGSRWAWSNDQRHKLLVRVGQLLDRPDILNKGKFRAVRDKKIDRDWRRGTQQVLVALAITTLTEQRAVHGAQAFINTLPKNIPRNVIDKIELKWRIRDWLTLTTSTNVPPNVRLAAAAVWEIGEKQTAYEIVSFYASDSDRLNVGSNAANDGAAD